MKPVMITLSQSLYLGDFVKGSFRAELVDRSGDSIELTVTLNGKAFKASNTQKDLYVKSFLLRLGEWVNSNLSSLNSQGIKKIKVKPKVLPLMKRLRSVSGQARFLLGGRYESFHVVVGEDYLSLDVPQESKKSERGAEHVANIRKLLKSKV